MLKKIVLTLAMVAFAANAFAASNFALVYGSSGNSPPSGLNFVPSKSVDLGYQADAPTTGNKSVYTIGSKNKAGDKIYATTSASTAVVWKSATAGAALQATDGTTLPTTPSNSAIDAGAGWSVL
jgi:hypothetical protein